MLHVRDAHFTPVDGRFVKRTPTQLLHESWATLKKRRTPSLVTKGVGGAGCGLREFVSGRVLKEELHRSELYEVFYAGLTNAQSIDELLDDLDD